MKIKHVSGKYWNEDNGYFGPVQAATEYHNIYCLPANVKSNEGNPCPMREWTHDDIRYYLNDERDSDAIALVVS